MLYSYNNCNRTRITDDCVTRALALATGMHYKKMHQLLTKLNRQYVRNYNNKYSREITCVGTNPTNGIFKPIYHTLLINLGWRWHPYSKPLPARGTIIVSMRLHIATIIDGVFYDTEDRRTQRIYGYYYLPTEKIHLL